MPSSTNDSRSQQIRAVIQRCVTQLSAGEMVSDAEVLAAHPELLPDLANALANMRRVAAAYRQASAEPTSGSIEGANRLPGASKPASKDGMLRVRCPHCHTPTTVISDSPLVNILCSTCGNRFGLISEADTEADADVRKRIDRFELLQRLGAGGFGTVWKARDTELDRLVAVKIPRRGQLTATETEQFLREARAAAQLRHPGIISIHEVGRDGDTVYIVSDLVEGVSLADFIAGQRITAREAARLCAQVAEALHHAHEQGVIHRDLKPANILLGLGPNHVREREIPRSSRDLRSEDSAGSETHAELHRDAADLPTRVVAGLPTRVVAGLPTRVVAGLPTVPHTPYLTDFGLARRETGEATLTLDGQLVGTPAYMSPEQARGEGHHVDRRSDIYSMGVILFELLTGELPFRGTTRVLLRQLQEEDPPRPRRLDASIPRDLETITLKCLEKEPARRYMSAQDLADELDRFLRGEPIHVRPLSKAARLWRWCRRNPVVASLSAGVVVSVGAVLLLLALSAIRERTRALDLQQTLARQYLRRGQSLCEQGDLARGLHWMARSLKEAPEQSTSLKDVIRENLAGWAQQWTAPRAILDNGAQLHAIALSPDGKRVVTSTLFEGTVQFWSVETGESLRLTKQHSSMVDHIAFSSDGRRVVTASEDNTARIWDAESGTLVGVPLRHEDHVRDAVFSPDGKLVATASRDKTARLWNSETGEPVGAPMVHDGRVSRVVFSPDGRWLMTGQLNEGIARVWSVPAGALISATIRGQALVNDLAISPDGMTVVTGHIDKTARLWSADSGLPIAAPMGHADAVNCVAFSPDGQRVLTGSADGTARLWDAKTAQPTDIVLKHQGDVLALQFSADGKWILTGAWDGAARLWAADTGEMIGLPLRHSQSPRIHAVALAGGTVLSGGGSVVALWSAQPATPEVVSPPRALPGPSLAFIADGSRVLIAVESNEGFATWWSPNTGQLQRSTLWQGGYLWTVALSGDGKRALVGGNGVKKAQLWSLDGGERLLFDLPHSDQVRAVTFSPDAKLAATACFDGNARLWSTDTGQPVGPRLQHSTIVEDVGFSPDGTLVVTACDDGAARIWSVKTGRQMGLPLRHRDSVLAATFSPDGKLVATGSRDNTARFWDVATGQTVGPALEHLNWVEDVCFSPDGKRLATASMRGVRLWSVEMGEQLGPALHHVRWPMEVAFSPDGKTIAVAAWSRDPHGTYLWSIPSPFVSDLSDEGAELRMQVLTWSQMDANGVLGQLDRATWRARRAQLDAINYKSQAVSTKMP